MIKRTLKTSYLNEEVNCTEPSATVSVPWTNTLAYVAGASMRQKTEFKKIDTLTQKMPDPRSVDKMLVMLTTLVTDCVNDAKLSFVVVETPEK